MQSTPGYSRSQTKALRLIFSLKSGDSRKELFQKRCMRNIYLAVFNIYIKEKLYKRKNEKWGLRNIQARYLFSVR